MERHIQVQVIFCAGFILVSTDSDFNRFLQALQRQAGIYFLILLGILVLFLLDAIREMRKYSHQG